MLLLKIIYYEFRQLLSLTAELNIKLQFCYKLLSEYIAQINKNFVNYMKYRLKIVKCMKYGLYTTTFYL